MSIFKSGSIRGSYGTEWDRETAYRIGYYISTLLKATNVVVGRDGRLSSPEIFDAITQGLIQAGCSVTDIGEIDTPGLVFANIFYKFDASIMITASHNPSEYNGLKISGKNGIVISKKNGLIELEKYINNRPDITVPGGALYKLDITNEYLSVLTPYKESIGNLKCIIDCSNGVASVLLNRVLTGLPGEFICINDEVDGSFPAHGPNPTVESNLSQLKNLILSEKADLGVCFDGDGDRMIVVDENGRWVSPDLITAFLGIYYFKLFPGKKNNRDGVLYDARSSNSISDYIQSLGGKSYISATGHTAMQVGLPLLNGIYGGELPGHYYYNDFYNLDNGWIPFLQVLAIISNENKSLSSIIKKINKYSFSGEMNFIVPEDGVVIQKIKEKYSSGKQTLLDGVRVDYPEWWFLIRMANTEPVLRLVVEGNSKRILKEKVAELKSFIYALGGYDHLS